MHRPPRVLLLGDSCRLAYQRYVADALKADGIATLFPESSTGRAACLEDTIDTYLYQFDPDIICFGGGPMAREELLLNDAPDAEPASVYRSQLQRLCELCIRRCGRQVVFVSMAPIDAHRLGRRGPAWARARATSLVTELTTADVVAIELTAQLNVMTADLRHELSPHADVALEADGVHLTPRGAELAGDAVARAIYGVL